MITMYDSVTPGAIPANAPAFAGYTAGSWPNYNALRQRLPHAHHVSIAIKADLDADCLDCESGDAGIGQAPEWVRRQHGRGIKRPIVYTSISGVAQMINALSAAGIPRDQYLVWSAHYTDRPHLCGPECGWGNVHADATQFTETALGRNLDESLCSDAFFGIIPDPLEPLEPAERKAAEKLIRLRRTHPTWHPHQLTAELADVVAMRKAVYVAAADGRLPDGSKTEPGWDHSNRRARYAELERLAPIKGA